MARFSTLIIMPKTPEGQLIISKGAATSIVIAILAWAGQDWLAKDKQATRIEDKMSTISLQQVEIQNAIKLVLPREIADIRFSAIDKELSSHGQRIVNLEAATGRMRSIPATGTQEAGYDQPRRAAQNLERSLKADADMASRATRPQ
jgi:hypothetical protein